MPVQNRIVKVQKRNRALVTFDPDRIRRAILNAARSIGGFHHDHLPDINGRLFEACRSDEELADFLADAVIVCLNSDPHHLITNFPPTIEEIQDDVLHVLRSYGFQNTADAYACYRWGRHWLREGAIRPDQFMGNGFPQALLREELEWARPLGCHTVAGLNEITRAGRWAPVVEAALARYEASLDQAARKVLERLNRGDPLRLLWISGPSSSGKTTTTVKLTRRLEKEGLRFLMLNLDDYFWSLVEHPTDWINDRNYETPEALDLQLLNRHLQDLLEGRPIEKPIYSFKEGRRIGTKTVRRDPDQVLLLDCLHGFYPPLTEGIDPRSQFRIYIETLHPLYEGDGSSGRLTRFTDVRLVRRMLRDLKHRAHRPLLTLLHWHYVRAGELFSIIPLMGLADHIVNGGFPFDWPLLRPWFLEPQNLWPRADELEPYAGFLDARIRYERVDTLLRSVEPIPMEEAERLLPGDALVREFIGGSTLPIPHNE